MKSSVIRARIDDDLKARACAVLEGCGLDPSVAIRLFLQEVVNRNGLPFDVRSKRVQVASSRQMRAMKQASQAADHAHAARGGSPGDSHFLVSPDQARRAKVRWPAAKLSD